MKKSSTSKNDILSPIKLKNTKQVKWFGWLLTQHPDPSTSEPRKEDIELTHMLIKSNKSISGFCDIQKKHFKIVGRLSKDNLVEFELLDENKKRGYIFRGEMKDSSIHGKYRVCQNSKNSEKGVFELNLDSKEWAGFMQTEASEKDDMQLSLNLNLQGIYSASQDDNGIFVVEGNLDYFSKKCEFSLFYVNLNSVTFFEGDWKLVNDQFVKITGNWSIHNRAMGAFELVGKMSPVYSDTGRLGGKGGRDGVYVTRKNFHENGGFGGPEDGLVKSQRQISGIQGHNSVFGGYNSQESKNFQFSKFSFFRFFDKN